MLEASLTLAVTAFLLLGSPEPVPVALAATGATFGFKKSYNFLIGIVLGIAVVIFATFLGLSTVFENYPSLALGLQILSAIYIMFIAYKIATASSVIGKSEGQAPGFKIGFFLNLINPKAYAAMLALIAQYSVTGDNSLQSLLIACCIIFMVAVIVDCGWLLLGHMIKPLFNHPKYQHWLRYTFALSLISLAIYNLIKVLFL